MHASLVLSEIRSGVLLSVLKCPNLLWGRAPETKMIEAVVRRIAYAALLRAPSPRRPRNRTWCATISVRWRLPLPSFASYSRMVIPLQSGKRLALCRK